MLMTNNKQKKGEKARKEMKRDKIIVLVTNPILGYGRYFSSFLYSDFFFNRMKSLQFKKYAYSCFPDIVCTSHVHTRNLPNQDLATKKNTNLYTGH